MLLEIADFFLTPSNAVISLFVVGLVCIFIHRFQRYGVKIIVLALAALFIIGSGPVAFWLMGSLEYRYNGLGQKINDQSVTSIVILAGYGEEQQSAPHGFWLNSATLYRLVEGARIYRADPDRDIWVTGGGAVTGYMRTVLIDLAVPSEKIKLDTGSYDTADSAGKLKGVLEDSRIFLVTSAGHMHRSVQAFHEAGFEVIPAPTHFLTRRNILATSYLPTPAHLEITDLAAREYMALFAGMLFGY